MVLRKNLSRQQIGFILFHGISNLLFQDFFNLLNATLHWFSLIYIAASIAKILFSCSHPCQEEAHCKTIVIYANSKINY